MPDRELATTRIALLELQEERRTALEGYALLDEKRMLLANRALATAAALERARREWQAAWLRAVAALRAAYERHGAHALESWPTVEVPLQVQVRETRVLGVRLPEAQARLEEIPREVHTPSDPSPEAVACAGAWRELLRLAAPLAATETALWRLADEYRRTERRTAAIEHVLLPELQGSIGTIEQALEGIDQEEAVRVRTIKGRRREA
jgi:H(+)-transporting ATP synthase subunit D